MTNIAIALASLLAVGWMIYRQFTVRPLNDRTMRISLILIIIGAFQIVGFASSGGQIGFGHALATVLGLVLAIALAYPRALTTRVFPGPDGNYLQRSTRPTLLLWIVAIAGHVALDYGIPALLGDHSGRGFAATTTMVFVGVTLFAQSWFLNRRVQAHRSQSVGVPAN